MIWYKMNIQKLKTFYTNKSKMNVEYPNDSSKIKNT